MSAIKKLLGQTAVYGLSSILGRMANYLLLTPLFARVFSVEQFGVITNVTRKRIFLPMIRAILLVMVPLEMKMDTTNQ